MPKIENAPAATYRPAVAGIVQDKAGRILICERSDVAGSWQFPQGGIEKGETPHEALARELREEIRLRRRSYKVLSQTGPYRYRFAAGRKKRGYDGQQHQYFLVRLRGPKSQIDIATEHREFQRTRWIWPHDFKASWLPGIKRRAYRRVFRDFFGTELKA